MTIQMRFPQPMGLTSFQLPPPSNAVLSVSNGIASVDEADVRIAMRAGFEVMAGQPWPQNETVRMMPPIRYGQSLLTSYSFPDGATITLTAGIAKIRRESTQLARDRGWSDAAPLSLLVAATATGAATDWPGGAGIFAVDGTSFSGATVALQYSTDGGTTWQAVTSQSTSTGLASVTAAGWASFSLSVCKIRAQISGGPPTGINANAIPGAVQAQTT